MKIMEIIRAAEGGMKEHYITLVKGMAGRGAEVTALGEFSGKAGQSFWMQGFGDSLLSPGRSILLLTAYVLSG